MTTFRRFPSRRCSGYVTALVACAATLVVFMVGYCVGTGGLSLGGVPCASWRLPEIPIAATATDSSEDIVIATGNLAEGVEGFFALDGLSGDLGCTVYNPSSRAFNTTFRRNVIADLQIGATKNPKFMMVTGTVAGMRRSSQPIASSLVYVVDSTSGRFAVYAVPWRRDLFSSGRAQQGELVLVQAGSVRTAAIRE